MQQVGELHHARDIEISALAHVESGAGGPVLAAVGGEPDERRGGGGRAAQVLVSDPGMAGVQEETGGFFGQGYRRIERLRGSRIDPGRAAVLGAQDMVVFVVHPRADGPAFVLGEHVDSAERRLVAR